jgi:hypothetical protein
LFYTIPIDNPTAGQVMIFGAPTGTNPYYSAITWGNGADDLDGAPTVDDTYTGTVITGKNCGEIIAQWSLVYMDDTEAEWMLADANAAGKFPALGMAVAACTNGTAGTILVQGVVRNDGWAWTGEGKALYLDKTTPGGMTETAPPTTGDCVQHIARVLTVTSDVIYFNPSPLWEIAP